MFSIFIYLYALRLFIARIRYSDLELELVVNVLFSLNNFERSVDRTRQTKMLTHTEYCDQLQHVCNTKLKCSDLVLEMQPVSTDGTVRFRAALPSSAQHTAKLNYLEFKISYSPVYQEPVLLFRLWRSVPSPEDGIDLISPWFPDDASRLLGIDNGFQVGLDAIFSNSTCSQETWFSIHPCDTAQIVGDRSEFKSEYLNRWLSIFLFSWLAQG